MLYFDKIFCPQIELQGKHEKTNNKAIKNKEKILGYAQKGWRYKIMNDFIILFFNLKYFKPRNYFCKVLSVFSFLFKNYVEQERVSCPGYIHEKEWVVSLWHLLTNLHIIF